MLIFLLYITIYNPSKKRLFGPEIINTMILAIVVMLFLTTAPYLMNGGKESNLSDHYLSNKLILKINYRPIIYEHLKASEHLGYRKRKKRFLLVYI